jgi:flagellar motor switch protein FliG
VQGFRNGTNREGAVNAITARNGSTARASALSGRKVLTRQQKAAVIVRLLLAEGAQLPLARLPDQVQTALTEQIGAMQMIDRDTLAEVVDEFCETLEQVGLAFPGGLDGALSMLGGQLSDSAASRLRRLAGASSTLDPWQRISGLSADTLLAVLESESTEVGAVIMSKLSVARAAELLGRLPGDKARRIAYDVSLTGNVAPDTVLRIGHSLAAQLDAQPMKAFDTGPVERVGAILNFSAAATRDSVLQGLEERDAAFAQLVRRAIFTFTNIPRRIDARDVPKILRGIDQKLLITALAGAKGEDATAAEFILANISQRMAGNLRDEMASLGKLKDKEVEEAMATVVAEIRTLEAQGEIFLIAEDEA